MSGFTIRRVNALFSMDNQSTGLDISQADDGTFKVSAVYRNNRDSGFPAREVIKREGRVYGVDVDGLASTVLAVCKQDWYHHYLLTTRTFYSYHDSQWNLRIEYANGIVRRWEGINNAPETFEAAYRLLVGFGMPELKLGCSPLESAFGARRDSDKSLDRITCYKKLLEETRALEREDEPSEDFAQVVDEFIEDVQRYLGYVRSDVITASALAAWGVEPNEESLTQMDVHDAPRAKMLTLFDALTQTENPTEAILDVLQNGTFERWCARLAAIPEEERREQIQERKLEHERLVASVEEAVRKRIADGKVFTAHDVAGDVGASTQLASMCIRNYVRNGKAQTVGSDYPRRYKAA